jgi:prevent-host-death family protein
MMSSEYSLYDAKANLSKIVKQVRESGDSVVITVHGQPAVEIRAYKELSSQTEERLAELRARGEILTARKSPRDYVFESRRETKPGGLKRFLDERADD